MQIQCDRSPIHGRIEPDVCGSCFGPLECCEGFLAPALGTSRDSPCVEGFL